LRCQQEAESFLGTLDFLRIYRSRKLPVSIFVLYHIYAANIIKIYTTSNIASWKLLEKVGILGAGPVGQILAVGLENIGYNLMISGRNIEKVKEWKKISGFKGGIGSYQESADFGELLILAVTGRDALEIINSLNKISFKNKTIIDTTNPINNAAPENGVLRFFTEQNKSASLNMI
jgi:NADP oxidoreductase coenzyme F420-dependent